MDVQSENPVPIRQILDDEIHRRDWRRAKWAYVLRSRWSLIVGDYLAKHTLLVSADSEAVVIAVYASSWTQELTYWKPEIKRRLDELTQGETRHAEVRIRVWPALFATSLAVRRTPGERGYRYHQALPRHETLTELLQRVQDNYESAVEHWMQSGYALCAECQSPTLASYRYCVRCERQRAERP
jgi:hypothetical protein